MRGQAMQGSVACQTVGRSVHAKAALPYRLHNAMTARAGLSFFKASPNCYKDATRGLPLARPLEHTWRLVQGAVGRTIIDHACTAWRGMHMHAHRYSYANRALWGSRGSKRDSWGCIGAD